MTHENIRSSKRPEPDQPMVDIANYVADFAITSTEAFHTARHMLLDSMACAMLALRFPECVKHLGPVVPGAGMDDGVPVPGTAHRLDPVQAAFAIGAQIRWLDFNDTWLAAEWGHPSDNLGAILAVGDYVSRRNQREGRPGLSVRDILGYAIKAHEIQGCYALKNSFNRVGMDHVILVRLASTAVATAMLGRPGLPAIGSRSMPQMRPIGRMSTTWTPSPRAMTRGPRVSWARRLVWECMWNAISRAAVELGWAVMPGSSWVGGFDGGRARPSSRGLRRDPRPTPVNAAFAVLGQLKR